MQKEYLCIFNDERSERLPVPAENEILVTYSELDATKTSKGPEYINNLKEWIQPDLILDEST